MSLQTRLESLVLRLAAEFKTIYGQVGTLANLSTTDKTNLVSSINELRSQISTLAGVSIIDDANAAGTATTFSASKITTLLDALKADLLGGADAAFDTLKELQDALLNDQTGIAALLAAVDKRVRFDTVQALTAPEQEQSMLTNATQRESVQTLWRNWTVDADAAGLTDFYGLQAMACRAMLEGGEALVRLRFRRPQDGLSVGLQLQVLEPEHLPVNLNTTAENGNLIRAGIEFDRLGRRVAYHLYRSHPQDGSLAPMSGAGDVSTTRVEAKEIMHLYRPLRPGQIRGEPWLARALVKLHDLDQYDDAELVRKKTAAMFAGFVTRLTPEDNLLGEGLPNPNGVALAGLEPGTMQILEPGEDIKFSQPADVGGSYSEFLRMQFRAVAAAMGVTYEQLTGDLTQVNYSSIRAGLLEFRRRVEALQHGVIVHQLCRPIWNAWMDQAVLEGALTLPGYASDAMTRRDYQACKWIPQGWQWVDPLKEADAMKAAIRCGLMSRSEAISANGYDAEDVDREIAADNARADGLGLVLDSDPRFDLAPTQAAAASTAAGGEPKPPLKPPLKAPNKGS